MRNKMLTVLLILIAGLISTSAFAHGIDLDDAIADSQQTQEELTAKQLQIHPPSKISHEGLIVKGQKMKREVIEGSGETVTVKASQEAFLAGN